MLWLSAGMADERAPGTLLFLNDFSSLAQISPTHDFVVPKVGHPSLLEHLPHFEDVPVIAESEGEGNVLLGKEDADPILVDVMDN